MIRAGGGFDASYNAQTAVDEAAHIIVAAELTNCGSDAGQLPVMRNWPAAARTWSSRLGAKASLKCSSIAFAIR